MNASRALNLALAVLILTLGGLLVAHRMRDAAPPPPPGFEELHAGAMTRVATGAPDSIEALERVAWGQKVRQQNDFDMATQRTNTALDPDLLSLYWAPEGAAAYIRTKEPDVLACLAEGRGSYDPQKRQETYKRCQALTHETAWWGYIWLQPWNYVLSKRLKGVPPMFASFWREEQFWLES